MHGLSLNAFYPLLLNCIFWFLLLDLVPYLTTPLSHAFSTLCAALRGPILCRTIQLGVVQRLQRMQNIPPFLPRPSQRRPYSPT